jgi:hypothetical protein
MPGPDQLQAQREWRTVKWLLLLALASPVLAQTPSATEQTIDVGGGQSGGIQMCGLITRFPGDIISPNCFQQSTNILSDRTGTMTRRLGYAQQNQTACEGSAPIRGMWPFFLQNGVQYLVMFSSTSMFYSPGDGSCTPIPGLHSVLSPTATMECVQALGQLWCADGVDPVFATTVTSTQAVTQAPIGSHIGTFRNRILVSGVPGVGPNGAGSAVYLSGELNGLDYTIPAVQLTTSPAIIQVNGTNDGLAVNCLMGEFQNQFLIGRPYDLWGLSGYDLSDFALRKISSQIGCLEPRSVQEVTNVLYWLSYRGVEGLSGTQINRVSYPIDSQILPIITTAKNTLTQTLTTQADWQSGNLTASGPGAPISATISPGDLVPSSATFVDNTTSTYVNGTLVNVSTRGSSSLALSISTGSVFDPNLTGTGWISSSTPPSGLPWVLNASNGSVIPLSGGATVQCPNGEAICAYTQIVGGSNATCSANTSNVFACIYDGATYAGLGNFNTSSSLNSSMNIASVEKSSSIIIAFSKFTPTCEYPFTLTRAFQKNTTPIGFNLVVDSTRTCSGSGPQCGGGSNTCQFISVSNVRVSSYSPTGTYTSSAFDTTFSTPIIGPPFIVAYTSSSVAALTYTNENSSDGISWSAPVALSTAGPSLSGKRYWRYLENFTTSNGTTTAISNGLVTEAETTGYYITPCILVASPTSFGNLIVNGVTNGGSFTFWVATGATCGLATATNAPWVLQTANAGITVSTGSTYIAARILFNVDVATEVPTLNDITFTWVSGAFRPATTSARWDDRYLLFFTTSTSVTAANDHIFIYDQNQKWQLWDDEPAASATLYLNRLYTGDSGPTGLFYQQDIGQSDNGNPFTMTFQTADFDGGDPNMRKQFTRAYMMLGAPSGSNGTATLNCTYTIDGSANTYPLGNVVLNESPENTGYFVAKLPFPASQPSTGHWLSMTCGASGLVGPIAIHRIRLVYSSLSWD